MALKHVVLISLLLSLLKLAGFFISGSLIVLASFYDSLGDALISYINFIFFQKAREKPDSQHPFGHGGFEVISGFVQGIFLALLGLTIAGSALRKLIWEKNQDLSLEALPWAIAVMSGAALAGFGIQWYLGRFEKQLGHQHQKSMSVKADRMHYMSDFWTNGLGALSLAAVVFSGYAPLDSWMGLLGSGFLFYAAFPLLKSSSQHIMQSGATPEVQDQILAVIRQTSADIRGVHRLRTRYLGPDLYIDFHLKLTAAMPLRSAHALGDKVERALAAAFPGADILIHLDPDDIPDEDDLL